MRIKHEGVEQIETRKGADYWPGVMQVVESLMGDVRELRDTIRTTAGVRQLGCEPRLIVNSQSMKLSQSAGVLAGIAICESTGAAPAKIRLRDGFDAGGDVIMPLTLAANECNPMWFLPRGISFGAGLFLEVVSGQVEGAVFLAPPR